MEDPVHVTLNTSASAMSPCVDITGPNMDLAAAAAGARATNMSLLWPAGAAGGRGPERHRSTGPTTTRPLGAG